MLGRAVGSGMLAGLAGVAAMTAAERLEQAVTHRPDCAGAGPAPPWTWPRDELLVDVAGAVADRLAAATGVSPGQRHAEPAGGARVHDVGPVPGGRMYQGHEG